MELSPEAQRIVAQAKDWTFECDNTLLQWMQKISDNMEQRANQTSQVLQKLNLSVKRTETALENVSNSLTALQYTQFVESRVHDDDEDETKVIPNVGDMTPSTPAKSSEEVLKTFLHNNIEMLNNCHEKYALDFDDSDDEDSSTTCIYQPKNPYNERPLPHIYGTKLWKENWHVGLSDGANDYSGDESEAFSETSTSTENNASADTNSANISGWPSSASITNEKYPTQIAVQSASSLHGSQPLFSTERINVSQSHQRIAAGSDDSKLQPRIVPNHRVVEHDLFAPLHGTQASASESTSASSASISAEPKQISNDTSSSSASRSEHIQRGRAPVDLFVNDEPPPIPPQTQTVKNAPIKRKPVNLFDDEDFNSFMNEIVDKVQTKAKPPGVEQEPVAASAEPLPIAAPRCTTNLFDEVHTKPTTAQFPPPTLTPKEEPKEVPKKSTVNLFDSSPENSPPRSSTIPSNISSKSVKDEMAGKAKETNTYITPKSLFDDDDEDDDDFLNVFGARKLPTQQKTTGKMLLFDDDMEDEPKTSTVSKEEKLNDPIESTVSAAKKANLFSDESDSDENGKDLFGTPKITTKTIEAPPKPKLFVDHITGNENSLFDSNRNTNNNHITIADKSNLFDEVNEEDDATENDLFTPKKSNTPPPTSKPPPALFAANVEDSDILQNTDGKTTEIANEKDQKKTEERNVNLFSESEDEKTTNWFETKSSSQNLESTLISVGDSQDTLSKPRSHKSDVFSDSLFPNDNQQKDELFDHSFDSQSASKEKVNDTNIREEHKTASIEVQVMLPSTSTPEAATNMALTAEDSGIVENQSTQNSTIQDEMSLEKENGTPISGLKVDALQKVSALSNYANIFSDEPPEDDDFLQSLGSNSSTILTPSAKVHNNALEENFDEPALPQVPGQDKAERQPAISDYSGLRLFSDVPPDDDDDNDALANNIFHNSKNVKEQESVKSLQHVFYDDFNETMQALQQPDVNKMPTLSLFDDEPPPDNGDFIVKSIKKRITDKIVVPAIDVNNANDDKRLGQSIVEDETDKVVIAAPIMDEKPHDTQTVKHEPSKPKRISKLPKVNINVHALLPNAKGIPNFKKSASTEEKHTSSNDQQAPAENVAIPPEFASSVSINAEQKSDENILTNLCKNRVRAPPKRRPSTRRGRQENYRKSLLIEDENFENKLEDVTVKSIAFSEQQENIVATKEPSKIDKALEQAVQSKNIESQMVKENVQPSINRKIDFNNLFPEDDDDFVFLDTTLPEDTRKEQSLIKDNTKTSVPIVPEQIQKENKSFENTIIEKNSAQHQKNSQYYPSDEPPDDFLFEPKPNRTKAIPDHSRFFESENHTRTLNSESEINVKSKTISTPLPESIFEPQTTHVPVPLPIKQQKPLNKSEVLQFNKPIPPPIASASQLFGDSDGSDVDDLFSSSSSRTTNVSKSKSVAVTNISKPPTTIDKKDESNKPIFLDEKSELDTDDLFKINRMDITAKQTTQTPAVSSSSIKSVSLFESDNEDNDDFLSSLKTPKPQNEKKTAKGESSKSLFSDEDSNDDDDDLFGIGRSSKNVIREAATKASTTKIQSQNKAAAVVSKPISDAKTNTTISDNPLADLL